MSDETRTLQREYREAHGPHWFGWSAARIIKREHTHIQNVHSVFIWQQKDDNGHWQWLVQCTRTNPPHTYTRWGTKEQCFAEASKWLECTVVMEGDDE